MDVVCCVHCALIEQQEDVWKYVCIVKILWVGNVDEWLEWLLYHVWFLKPHTHVSALTVLALLKNTNKW